MSLASNASGSWYIEVWLNRSNEWRHSSYKMNAVPSPYTDEQAVKYLHSHISMGWKVVGLEYGCITLKKIQPDGSTSLHRFRLAGS